MSSFFRWGSNPDQLSLSYNRDSVKSKPFTTHTKKVLCECLTESDNFGDYQKLNRFLHLERHELYPAMIKTNSAVDDCISFIKQYRAEGYWNFICIVKYCVARNDVHGNHYIIGCKQNDQLCSQIEKLRARKEIKFTTSYPCVVLKNFTDVKHSFLEEIFPNIISPFIYDSIVLGKMVTAPSHRLSDQKFDRQMHNIRAHGMAKNLLQIIRQRLHLPEKYQLTFEKNVNICMSDVCTKLTTCLSTLQSATDILAIKNAMLKINENLIIFVGNYYFYLQSVYDGGSEIADHDRICSFLQNGCNFIVKNQRYQTINDVFCEYYDFNKYYTTPVIFVTETNFELLLSVFKTKGFTTLKLRKVHRTDEDDDWLFETTGSWTLTKVNLTRFEVSKCPPDSNAILSNYFTPCGNELGKNYLWICINCETLVKVDKQGNIMCGCGVKVDQTNPKCLKCVANNRSLDNKLISHDVELQNNVYNDKQASVIVPITATTGPLSYTSSLLSSSSDLVPLSAAQFLPPKPRTILVMGKSAYDTLMFNNTNNGRRQENENGPIADYISLVINGSPIDWTLFPDEIHGFIIVVKTTFLKITQEDFQTMIDMVPPRAAKNCCVVIMQTETYDFSNNIDNFRKSIEDAGTKCFVVDSSWDGRAYTSLRDAETNVEEFILAGAELTVTIDELINKYVHAEVNLEAAAAKSIDSGSITSSTDSRNNDAICPYGGSDVNMNRLISFYEQLSHSACNATQSRSYQTMSDGIAKSDTKKCEYAAEKDYGAVEVPPNYNVLILGSSAATKQSLLNTLYCVKQHATFDDAVQNAENIAFQDSDDYVVDYGTHTIRYINKDALNIKEFDIHGVMIVVDNNTPSQLPRCAIDNCCVVNTFYPTETFNLKDANQQMSEWIKIFCDQHGLTDSPNFICLDTVKTRAILNNSVNTNVDMHRSSYESCKRQINRFLQNVQTAQPITSNDLLVADNWKRLCDVFRPHIRGRDPETLRLMATIADNTLTGLAIYCRRNKGDAQSISDDERSMAVAHWKLKDDKVVTLLQQLWLLQS